MRSKVFLSGVFVFVFLFGRSQHCKYDLNKYDKFLKVQKLEKVVKVVKKFNRGNGYLDIEICKYGDQIFYRASTASLDPIVVGTGDQMMFLLDNDEIIKANPDKIYSADYNGARFIFKGTYFFQNNNFEKLKSNKVKSIRLYYNNVYHDFEVKDKGQEELRDAATCF
ncbi:MAG: hypothetical protein IT214_09455 [Chitinophagaceae bacterium]|nr:hypothetical protein [Chitinophagaceae bacterium]